MLGLWTAIFVVSFRYKLKLTMNRILLLAIGLLAAPMVFGQSFMAPTTDDPIANRGALATIVANEAYQGFDEPQAYFGEGEFEIFLDFLDETLDRPIIILDGFDPGDQRDITGLYNSLEFDGQNMADLLRAEGYDIVILNQPVYTTEGYEIDGGADFIQRNGLVLAALIEFLNAEKVGDEELVVLGPSMGGLIGRYGLAWMEANSLDHETRLFISFDSPHKGANIPISIQYLINYLAEDSGDPDATAIVDQVLNSPAAKQMLLDHYSAHLLNGSTFEQDPNKLLPDGAENFRDEFQAELDALGFAQNVRNVAMINGAGDGTTSGTPGMEVVNTTLDLGPLITADVAIHFTPEASQTNNVAQFDTFVAGFPAGSFGADAQSTPESDGVDSAPGGTSNFSDALEGGAGNPVIEQFIEALNQDQFCFIPTLSALAIDEADWFAPVDIGGTHSTPFVNYYIPPTNEDHVDVTAESAAFAIEEILQGSLGQEDVLSQAFRLEQNPVSGLFNLRTEAWMHGRLLAFEWFASTGQLIGSSSLTATSVMQLTAPRASGVYLLRISTDVGATTLKVVVR